MDGFEADELVVCNGIDAVTGRYALEPLSVASVAARARQRFRELEPLGLATRGPFDNALFAAASDLGLVGWGVIFPRGASAELRAALEPLLSLRRAQAGDLYRELEFDSERDHFRSWLARHDIPVGVVDCELAPFYLLIVGPPVGIPHDFQYLLDVTYAVGRLAFDTLDEYRAYARSVVNYERQKAPVSAREVVYWAPRHAGDAATQLSSERLVAPLVERTSSLPAAVAPQPVRSVTHLSAEATKVRLLETLHRGPDALPPALLFTASHGVAWPSGHEQQQACQGALLAQDWEAGQPVTSSDVVAAADVSSDARIWGSMVFSFACYSAGSPAVDPFEPGATPVAEQPFVSALPKRLLGHPGGGALAFIGHVDRAWGYSIRSSGTSQIQPFKTCVEQLLRGFPVGFATSDFSARYSSLSASLLNWLSPEARDRVSEQELARAWVERTDSQNYVVLGDPAVRLRAELLV